MRNAAQLLRFPVTVGLAFVLLTVLIWYAPGRDVNADAWGQSTGSVEMAREWASPVAFGAWYFGELAHRRAGTSTLFGVPVAELISERAAVTIGHAWRGFAAAWLAAIAAGIASHFWPGAGRAALALGSAILSLPVAFLALSMTLYGAAVWVALMVCLWPKAYSYWETLLQGARRRTHVLSLLAQGAGPWRAQWHAIWRPEACRFLGLLAVTVPLILGTLIPLEVLCDEPGLGQLAWKAVGGRDLPLLAALSMLFTAATCGMSLMAEWASPEIR